jgi:single-stranded-DNA-specific exonuclease
MTYRAWEQKPLDRTVVRELTAAIAEQAVERLEEQAMDEAPWSDEKYKAVLAAQQKENALLAGILAARGITDPAEALTLLAGEEELSDPALLTDMDAACQRIWQAIDNGETIAVFGDYDVDGVTATALLYQHLKGMGATVKCMLPSREGDGYGLSKNAIQSMHNKGCTLIVTVDNGISAVEEAEFAASLGMDLIITDHHLPPETLPKAVAVVDPRREDDHSPFKGLCGAGVAFKLCAALDGCPPEEMLDYCGDLAAVGTVADVMPLVGENRTLVKAGLQQLQQTDRPGFGALLEEVGLAGKPITAENISYAIAPRINAAGRMDNAVTALQLVLCEDPDRAGELAHKLNEINAHRQETEQQIFKAAEELLEQQPERLDDRIMLLWGRDWHPGVIGIVASRLVERTGRPVIVVTIDEHGEGKGSGRSVQGFNLHTCIGSCADLLVRYGGHAMAAGLSVREENLPELRRRLNEWAARECPVLHTPPLTCDVTIHLDRITVESVRHLDQLAPYGAENPTPVFLLQSAVVDGVYPVSEGRHSRLRLRQGNACLYAVWFGMPAEQLPYALGDVVDVALNLSVYESTRGAQLSGRIIDLHPAGLGAEMARQAALVQALRRGTPLTEEQKRQIAPARTDIIAVYRELQARRWHAEDLQPLCAKLGEEQTGKTLVAVTALEQVGLITAAEKGGAKFWELVPTAGKKNLADAPILKCLEEL